MAEPTEPPFTSGEVIGSVRTAGRSRFALASAGGRSATHTATAKKSAAKRERLRRAAEDKAFLLMSCKTGEEPPAAVPLPHAVYRHLKSGLECQDGRYPKWRMGCGRAARSPAWP